MNEDEKAARLRQWFAASARHPIWEYYPGKAKDEGGDNN